MLCFYILTYVDVNIYVVAVLGGEGYSGDHANATLENIFYIIVYRRRGR